MTATDDWSDGPNPSPERQAFHAPAVDIRDVGGTVTATDDRTPNAEAHDDSCHSPECPCWQAALKAAWGNADPTIAALRAEVERLQAENAEQKGRLIRRFVEVERLQAEADKRGKQSNEMTKRAMLAEAEVARLQAAARSLIRALDNDEEGMSLGGYDHLADEIGALRHAVSPAPTEEP